jgi:multiple antibiotic resistance protein
MALSFLKMLFTMLIVVDPVGLVPVFLSLTADMDAPKRRKVTRTSAIAAFLILCLFILAGAPMLSFLGISPGAFYVSGGLLLLLMAVDMVYGKARLAQNPPNGGSGGEAPANVAIFPLAIPMMAGPGAITAIMLYMSSGQSGLETGALLIASALVTVGAAVAAMRASEFILRAVGKLGVTVLERIMGLLLSGLSIEYVYRGLCILGIAGP